MRITGIAFSEAGVRILQNLRPSWDAGQDRYRIASRYEGGEIQIQGKTGAFLEEHFQEEEAWIFCGSCGMVIRLIKDLLIGKDVDPAVLVLDEGGRFVIPLVSGHLGGANLLAERLAAASGRTAVITTATDGRGAFAVDAWAKSQELTVVDPKCILPVSQGILQGKTIACYSEIPIRGELPEELELIPDKAAIPENSPSIYIHRGAPEEPTGTASLELILREYGIGIGCRKGTDPDQLEEFVSTTLEASGIRKEQVRYLASIDLKSEEPALVRLSRKWRVPFYTYPADVLREVPGAFHHSDFVEKTVGVDNVCERAAMVSGEALIVPRTAAQGMTIAISHKDRNVSW